MLNARAPDVPPSSPQTADPTDDRVRPMHAAVGIADRSQAVNTADCSYFNAFFTISTREIVFMKEVDKLH